MLAFILTTLVFRISRLSKGKNVLQGGPIKSEPLLVSQQTAKTCANKACFCQIWM